MQIKKALASILIGTIPLASQANLAQQIKAILHHNGQPAHIGVIIRQANTGRIIYSQGSRYLFSPASVQKLFTATAALSELGPNFTFNTKLLTNGTIKHNTLHGNLIVKFSGDPELTSDDIQELLDQLKSKHITKINGRVYIDTSVYDQNFYPPGWLWDDLSYSYAAPLSAATIDKNKFILRLTPAQKIGQAPDLSVDIPNHIVSFTNEVKTTAQYNKNCPLTIYSDASNHYTLEGCLNKNWGRQRRNLALRNPIPLAKYIIKNALSEDNIAYKGEIQTTTFKRSGKLLAEHKSAPLRKLLKDMLKKSDNLITDALLKELGHHYYKKPGSWQNGIAALKKQLNNTGINFKKNLIDDGAGLSRYNLLTPYQLSQLLDYIYKTPQLKNTMIESLPIGGIDGTLVERMFSEAKEKRIKAKTGSMTGVSALAGYIYTRHLGVLSFAIIINGFIGKHTPYSRLEDKLCEHLARYSVKRHG